MGIILDETDNEIRVLVMYCTENAEDEDGQEDVVCELVHMSLDSDGAKLGEFEYAKTGKAMARRLWGYTHLCLANYPKPSALIGVVSQRLVRHDSPVGS